MKVRRLIRQELEPRTMLWIGNKGWSWGAAMGDCLCEDCAHLRSWHPSFEFNCAKIYDIISTEGEFIEYVDDAWLGFFILTQLRYLRVGGYWDGENEAQILNNTLIRVMRCLRNQ